MCHFRNYVLLYIYLKYVLIGTPLISNLRIRSSVSICQSVLKPEKLSKLGDKVLNQKSQFRNVQNVWSYVVLRFMYKNGG